MELSKVQVFMVEDDEMGQLAVEWMLKSMGVMTIDIAATGKEAINMVEKKEYDIYFIDIGLPDIEGFEVMKKICELYGNDSEIYALTGHSEEIYKINSLKCGAKDLITKPLTPERFHKIADAL